MVVCFVFLLWVLPGPDLVEACPRMCVCLNSTSVKISCEGSGLTELSADLPTTVTSLDLTRNRFRILDMNSLGSLPNLVDLKLKENGLEEIDEGAFHGVRSLQVLDLSGNNLTVVDRTTFRDLTGLLHLDLSGNQLTEVDGAFAGLADLSRLDLRQNRLSVVTQSTLSGLYGLRYLRLDDNMISHIDSRALLDQQRLMYFVLKGNPIGHVGRIHFNSEFLSYVDISESGLVNLPKGLPGSVRYLQLRRNKLSVLHQHSFEHCTNVTILVLDENGLEEIEPGSLVSMSHLQQLWLHGNRLRAVPRPLPSSVQRLFMDLNDVQGLSEDDFPVASQLNTLSLMGNNISTLPSDAFRRLSILRHLDLSGNSITHLRRNTFSENPLLQLLQLSKNPLARLEAGCFHGLRELHTLSMAYVPTLSPSLEDSPFLDLSNLKKLDLDTSPGLIRTFVSHQSDLASSLQDLNMYNSDLRTLHADFVERFPNLAVLRISSHSWHCDVRIAWLKEWLMSTPLHVENRNKCATPASLKHRTITSLSSSDFQSTLFEAERSTTSAPLEQIFPTYLIPVSQKFSTVLFSKDREAGRYVGSESPQVFTPVPRPGWVTAFTLGVSYGGDKKQENVRLLTWDEIMGAEDFFYREDGAKGSEEEQRGDRISPERKRPDDPMFPAEGNTSLSSDDKFFNVKLDSSLPKPSSEDGPGNTIIVSTVTITATVLAAVVMVTGIVYLCRRKNAKKVQSPRVTMPTPIDGDSGSKASGEGYSLKATSCGGWGGRSLSVMAMESRGEIVMSLVPGRDINHEGPLRVYKWEDF